MPSIVRSSELPASLAASAAPAASIKRRMSTGPTPSVSASLSQCSIATGSPLDGLERLAHQVLGHIVADHDVPDPVGQDEADRAAAHLLVELHGLHHLID